MLHGEVNYLALLFLDLIYPFLGDSFWYALFDYLISFCFKVQIKIFFLNLKAPEVLNFPEENTLK